MKYVEFCAGIGGTRAGLDSAGWRCVLAVDNDPDAVAVHRLVHGSAVERDVIQMTVEEIPDADTWVAGFPCQPFSTSGNRLGFVHRSGNVFEHLARLIGERRPPVIVLENVEGLLSNKSGHTFSVVLSKLTSLGYVVDWLVMDLRWFGPPHTRKRLFIVAAQEGVLTSTPLQEKTNYLPGIGRRFTNVFGRLLQSKNISYAMRSEGHLADIERTLSPSIGKPRPSGRPIFGLLGHASKGQFVSFDISDNCSAPNSSTLGAIVAPRFESPDAIRSGRYYARGGPTTLCLREEPISHCVGTSLGGAPLYAVPLSVVKNKHAREAFLEYANWHREEEGYLVMRLRPNRAILLFGPNTEAICDGLARWEAGETRKYKLVGNMVAPVCARTVATMINENISGIKLLISRKASTPSGCEELP